MDVIRSAYIGKMRFSENDDPVKVKWFFADKNAEVFSAPTIFRSADCEPTPNNNNGLGEQRPPRGQWVDGMRPSLLRGLPGQNHFPVDWWENGVPSNVVQESQTTTSGEQVACVPPVAGIRFGGSASATQEETVIGEGGLLFGGSAIVVPF